MYADPIRVFWAPGCSACVKTKEFLTKLGVAFDSVNVHADQKGAADLAALGARSLPVVSRGKEFIFAQSMDMVAEFVGRKGVSSSRLKPEVLVERWQEFLAVARSMALEIPPEKLTERAVANRDRSIRELTFHIFQIPDVFVRNAEGEFVDWADPINMPPPADMKTSQDIVEFADYASAKLAGWWDAQDQRDCLWTIETHYGARPAWELLERQCWHSAQHTRQIQSVLEGFGVKMKRTVPPALYDGLPMPDALWE